MNTANKKIFSLMCGAFAGMLSAFPAAADDTEIYLGQNLGVSDVKPNILFVVDTSGSMSTGVTTQTTYDPGTAYSGCFSATRVYYSSNNDCTTSSYFNLTALKCQAGLNALNATGFYQDRMGQWRSSQWKTFSTSNHTSDIECQADSGVHGNGGAATYAANGGSGPWSTSSASSINWNASSSYTIKSGNYKNWEKNFATVTKSRIDIVKETVTSLVNSINNVNIGLMRFDRNAHGGMVISAMGDIATVKSDFLTAVNGLPADSYTPLAETMYEAARYYRGGNVLFGNTSTPVLSVAASRTTGTTSGATYKSPIEFQCQKNFIAYLTDGDPTQDTEVTTAMMTQIGGSACSGNCLDEIAGTLATADQSSAFADVQKVSTYTIGFGDGMSSAGIQLLQAAAQASKNGSGAGEYYAANDSVELTNAFTNIITDILGVSTTFSSPAVSVNAFNRTTHRSDLYFSLFKPQAGPHWDGNFKRYRLSFNSNGDPVIVDVNNVPAVNTLNGYFQDNSTSYWTPPEFAPDGKEAPEGGSASKLTNTRNVYTNTGTSDLLSDASNLLHESNGAVTQAMLGAADATEREALLKWSRGIDVDDEDVDGSTTDARLIMGDPLHSEPAMIQYGGSNDDPDITAYVATNDGYLHAISTLKGDNTGSSSDVGGRETFSFVPRELLGNLKIYRDANNGVTKTYGIDGSITAWVRDGNKDGIINGADKAYIFFGMRRGGNNYYAMDVTDRSNPRLMWTIHGGSGDFAELAQSWSQPVLRKVRLSGADKYVLIFAGGYDTQQDAVSTRTADGEGRAVYIVDALTGTRLWWASSLSGADLVVPEMDYSIPSNVSAADANGDGYVDLIYVGDMGGQIFRFDIRKSETGTLTSLITGGRIADLAGSGTDNNRRFYYPPSVAIAKSENGNYYLALAIASGYREHPLNSDIADRIYMIKDSPVSGSPGTYVTINEVDLFNTTDNLIREGSAAQQATAKDELENSSGWYIELETQGEKGLAKGLIFGGNIYITSYIPTDAAAAGQTCQPSEGTGRLYVISLTDGGPADGTVKDDRSKSLNKPGIPADPKMIKTDDANQDDYAVCVGTECMKAKDTNTHESLYWFER